MYIVGFTGSHCTGKTTTARLAKTELEERGYKVLLIQEVVRKLNKRELGTISAQLTIHKLMAEELAKARNSNYDIVLTDRTPLDVAYYTLYYFIKNNWSAGALELARRLIESSIAITVSFYDLLIFMDGLEVIPIEDDGFRLTDEHSRICIDIIAKLMIRLLPNHMKVVYIKPNKPAEEVAIDVANIIERMLEKHNDYLSF